MTRRIGYIFGALALSLYTRNSLDPQNTIVLHELLQVSAQTHLKLCCLHLLLRPFSHGTTHFVLFLWHSYLLRTTPTLLQAKPQCAKAGFITFYSMAFLLVANHAYSYKKLLQEEPQYAITVLLISFVSMARLPVANHAYNYTHYCKKNHNSSDRPCSYGGFIAFRWRS